MPSKESKMSSDDIKSLAKWAIDQGALHVRVGDFEMSLGAPPRVEPMARDQDLDDATIERQAKEESWKLMTHSA